VLADEPGLQLVGTEDVADDEVVGALVAGLAGIFGDVEAALNDDLVGFEEPGDLDGHLFPAARRALNAGGFGHVAAHGDGDAAEELNALGDGVDHLDLLVEVLVEEEVELVEGRAGDLPVVLLVHVAQGDGVGQKLVEFCDHVGAHFGPEGMGHVLDDGAVLLDLFRVGVPVRRDVRAVGDFLDCNCHFCTSLCFQVSDAARLRSVSFLLAQLLDRNFRGDGHSRTQGEVAIFLLYVGEVDANGDALNDLDVVAGGVLGREEREP